MKFKQTSLILLLLAMLPAIFYTAYEFSSLSETEVLMQNIYEQQMNNILFNVNQSAWTRTSDWSDQLRKHLHNNEHFEKDSLLAVINAEPGIQCIFLTDSLFRDLEILSSDDTAGQIAISAEVFLNTLRTRRNEINRMIYRKSVGYDKPVSVVFDGKSDQLLSVVFTYQKNEQSPGLLGICIDAKHFIESIFTTIDVIPQEEIEVGIFNMESGEIVDRLGDITFDSAAALKPVWIFPNYMLGVKMVGVDLNQEVQRRFRQRFRWTILLNSFLIITLIFLYRNIRTEMKLTRIKSDFVSNVSHELRTPLALIRMYAETLSMDRVRTESKKQEYYTVITKESERLSHLVNTILDFSKMESGKKKYNFRELDLNAIVEDVMEMYSFHLTQKDFSHKVDIFDEKLIIKGDYESISEALINLLDNAMKYSDKIKEIIIQTGKDDQHCWVEVTDKGPGIRSSELSRIFDKFYRVSPALVHDTKGSGLGLALVDYIMKAHIGKVTVKSKPGKGSSFRLNFPKIKTVER